MNTQPTAGYSTRSLPDKLGIKPNMMLYIGNMPEGYLETTLRPLPEAVSFVDSLAEPLLWIQQFIYTQTELTEIFPLLKAGLLPKGSLWISWLKRTASDIKAASTTTAQRTHDIVNDTVNEAFVREVGLAHGLVDVKVTAIDSRWSGLKFMYRRVDRPREGNK